VLGRHGTIPGPVSPKWPFWSGSGPTARRSLQHSTGFGPFGATDSAAGGALSSGSAPPWWICGNNEHEPAVAGGFHWAGLVGFAFRAIAPPPAVRLVRRLRLLTMLGCGLGERRSVAAQPKAGSAGHRGWTVKGVPRPPPAAGHYVGLKPSADAGRASCPAGFFFDHELGYAGGARDASCANIIQGSSWPRPCRVFGLCPRPSGAGRAAQRWKYLYRPRPAISPRWLPGPPISGRRRP